MSDKLVNTLRTIQTVADTAQALDGASDLLRSTRTLRRRADTARLKAEAARTRLGHMFWLWRSGRLNDRADRIERE
jgi:hypothetical protein